MFLEKRIHRNMILNKKIFLTLFCITFGVFLYAQGNIKSIQLKTSKPTNFSTIVPLGQVLQLSFDDLQADQKEYSYKIEHMNADWTPSNIPSNIYIIGFNQNRILRYENSFNTFQNYTHYSVQIPNSNTQITKSGNYLISVLNEYEEVIFTRKFTYYESNALVGVSVIRSSNTSQGNQQQTVQFTINYNGNEIRNPSQEIETVVIQNNNWKTAIYDLKPQFYRNNQLVYKYFNKPNFWSGNEYLNFDNKQIRNSTIQIARVEKKDIYHSYLYPQQARKDRPYTYFPDINGHFIIRTIEANKAQTEADYAMVHFSLDSRLINNKEIYVYGAFNDFSLTTENKMKFNTNNSRHETAILLKQGFYNYTFVTKDKSGIVNPIEINGSFDETENEYSVVVYYQAFGENYQRVLGLGTGFINVRQ